MIASICFLLLVEIPYAYPFNLTTCTNYLLTVHYEGILAETEEVFDTTREDNTVFSFELGLGTVIKAWDIALRTMKVKIQC